MAVGHELRSWYYSGVRCAYIHWVNVKAERLHLRVDTERKALSDAATGTSVSTFVLAAATEVATEAAADVLADRRVFALDQLAWKIFDEMLARPASDVAGLRELLTGLTVLNPGQARDSE